MGRMGGDPRPPVGALSLCAYYTKKALRYIAERNDGKNYLQSPYETILMQGGTARISRR